MPQRGKLCQPRATPWELMHYKYQALKGRAKATPNLYCLVVCPSLASRRPPGAALGHDEKTSSARPSSAGCSIKVDRMFATKRSEPTHPRGKFTPNSQKYTRTRACVRVWLLLQPAFPLDPAGLASRAFLSLKTLLTMRLSYFRILLLP